MFKSILYHIAALLTALFFAVGCAVDDDFEGGSTQPTEGIYGSWQFGEEQVPVNMVVAEDNGWFQMVVISPLTDMSSLTTSAIIGVQYDLLGREIDVARMSHNYDYVMVYEDPLCYYAPYRPLSSGTIFMQKTGDKLRLDIDVVLYDGTPFVYSYEQLPIE